MSNMHCNMLGVAWCHDDLPKKLQKEVEEVMEKIIDKHTEAANAEFDKWLEEKGLEQAMGVILKKGVVK